MVIIDRLLLIIIVVSSYFSALFFSIASGIQLSRNQLSSKFTNLSLLPNKHDVIILTMLLCHVFSKIFNYFVNFKVFFLPMTFEEVFLEFESSLILHSQEKRGIKYFSRKILGNIFDTLLLILLKSYLCATPFLIKLNE